MKYVEITKKTESNKEIKEGFLERTLSLILDKILNFLLPKANPDFEDKINLVKTWLLEFENNNSIPEREIGLDEKGSVLVKMPYKNNYGYWVDNNLTFKDFENKFNLKIIDKDKFESKWNEI